MKTLDDYTKLIAGIKTPDDLTAYGGTLLQMITDDLAEAENYKKQTLEQEGKIKSLQDTNMKLFLSKVIEPNMKIDKEDEEPTPATIAQKLFN